MYAELLGDIDFDLLQETCRYLLNDKTVTRVPVPSQVRAAAGALKQRKIQERSHKGLLESPRNDEVAERALGEIRRILS